MEKTRYKQWDKDNLRTISTKLRKEEYLKLIDWCNANHIKPYTLLKHSAKSAMRNAVGSELRTTPAVTGGAKAAVRDTADNDFSAP